MVKMKETIHFGSFGAQLLWNCHKWCNFFEVATPLRRRNEPLDPVWEPWIFAPGKHKWHKNVFINFANMPRKERDVWGGSESGKPMQNWDAKGWDKSIPCGFSSPCRRTAGSQPVARVGRPGWTGAFLSRFQLLDIHTAFQLSYAEKLQGM